MKLTAELIECVWGKKKTIFSVSNFWMKIRNAEWNFFEQQKENEWSSPGHELCFDQVVGWRFCAKFIQIEIEKKTKL